MAFFDRFKGENKEKPAAKPQPKAGAPRAHKADDAKVETKAPAKAVPPKDSTAYRVLVHPLVSEKTVKAEKNRQFVFVVAKDANKVEIKKAVEKHYKVHVTGVNVVNVEGKKINRGRVAGKRKDWRKAYVTVRSGESITF